MTTVGEASVICESIEACRGFTFDADAHSGGDDERDPGRRYHVFFKGIETARARRVQGDAGGSWRTFVLPTVLSRCAHTPDEEEEGEGSYSSSSSSSSSSSDIDLEYSPPVDYTVEILRDEPLVAVVPNFATPDECDSLMNETPPDEEMGRAHEFGQTTSTYRKSYSSNVNVDYEDRASPVTRFAERTFSFVRDMTGLDVRGPGQEPINAVLYKRAGDEYRPHCDGPCHGGRYKTGDRVATTIVYCDVPPAGSGGQTSFTRSGLMIQPRRGDLLLFTYKFRNNTVDNGFTEHSGCPIRGEGGTALRKWIATQWYREGVDYDRDWESYAYPYGR